MIHFAGLPGFTACGLPVKGLHVSQGWSSGCPGCLAYRQELTAHARALWPWSPGARPPEELVLAAPSSGVAGVDLLINDEESRAEVARG